MTSKIVLRSFIIPDMRKIKISIAFNGSLGHLVGENSHKFSDECCLKISERSSNIFFSKEHVLNLGFSKLTANCRFLLNLKLFVETIFGEINHLASFCTCNLNRLDIYAQNLILLMWKNAPVTLVECGNQVTDPLSCLKRNSDSKSTHVKLLLWPYMNEYRSKCLLNHYQLLLTPLHQYSVSCLMKVNFRNYISRTSRIFLVKW